MPNKIISNINLNGTTYLIGATEDNNGNEIATHYATKSELNELLAVTDAMIFRGSAQSMTDIPAIHNAGWTYKVATAGTYVGQACEEGDLIICVVDGTTANNADWIVLQRNVNKALYKAENAFTNGHMLLADGTAGQVKSTAINPKLTYTQGASDATPQLSMSVGSIDSNTISFNSATTGIYGVTKLTNTVNSAVENLAATPKLVSTAISNAIGALDKSDTADSTKYVSAVSEADGKITVSRELFSPSVSISQGTSSAGPAVGISVAGNSSVQVNIPAATTSLYGVTKLSSTSSSTAESVAATPKGVWNAINTLDGSITGTPGSSKTFTAFSQTDGKVTATVGDISIAASQVSSGTLSVERGGTGQTSVANIQAGKDGSGNTITETYATKSELNNWLALTDAMIFKGTIQSAADVPAVHDAGWTYKVAKAGTYAGKVCEVGDLLICTIDGTVANNDEWAVVQTNVDSALFKGTNTFADGQMLLADSTAGKVKAVNIGTSLSLTQGTSENAPKLKVTVGGVSSSEVGITRATTSIIGVTKLSSTAGTDETTAATPKLVSTSITSAIQALDVSDTVDSTKYVSSVSEADGKITVGRTAFSPSVSIAAGTSDLGPKVSISIAGNSATSGAIGTATTGIYGVTKLTNATNSTSESLAATAKAVKAAYDLAASKTSNVGTITGVTAGTGLSGGGTSGTVTLNHSNSVTAITTPGLYKVAFDANGHITSALAQSITDNTSNTDVTSTDTNLITGRTLYYQLAKKGYTTNTGTVTSVTIKGGEGITVDSTSAITTSGTRTITHASPEGASATTYNSGTDNANRLLKTITTDKFGHVTGGTSAALATTTVGSASAGTAISADDITAWTTNTPTAVTKKTVVTSATFNTVVTGGSKTSIPNITKKTVVTEASYANGILTLSTGDSVTTGTAIEAYTSLTTGASGSATTGDSVTVTAGTAASLSYTSRTIPNISVTNTTVATGAVS